ncbi:MAG: pyridoxamine 5'-phosphate oxidase [Planctomycetota bacterium]
MSGAQRDSVDVWTPEEELPDPLPESPLAIVRAWFDEAHEREVQPNPNAFTLATVDPDGRPSGRVVLCKGLDTESGELTFYTNYRGRKSRALDAHPYASAVFHWDTLERQIRIEGPVRKTDDATSDAYFATRPWESKVGAWASEQSEPLADRDDLLAAAAERALELGLNPMELEPGDRSVRVPRPPHWGGWVIAFERVELWCGGPGRVHDRAEWVRELSGATARATSVWSATRLQP